MAMHPAVRYPIVVLGLPEIELAHCRHEARGPRRTVDEHHDLLRSVRMLFGRRWDHVPNPLPDLVQAIEPRPASTLKKLIEPDG